MSTRVISPSVGIRQTGPGRTRSAPVLIRMLKTFFCAVCATATIHLVAAERTFDFSDFPLNQAPAGFVSTVTGGGKPGDWRIIEDDVPSVLPSLSPNAPIPKRHVLAQLSQDSADEHFPLLIFSGDTFGDFILTTRFKSARGTIERMAGIAFRIQDEKNYYVLRASAEGNSFKFYKFVDGVRSPPIGAEVEIPRGVWQEMKIECKGNQIRCALNGRELFPTLTDNSFAGGRIGFWTKSDSVSYFVDTHLEYTPRELFAQVLTRSSMQQNPRLVGLKIFSYRGGTNLANLRMIGSDDGKELGGAGAHIEEDVIRNDHIYHAKGKETISVTVPLHDRNGETVAALRVVMKPFPGQTEENAVARTIPIKKAIEAQIQTAKDLLD